MTWASATSKEAASWSRITASYHTQHHFIRVTAIRDESDPYVDGIDFALVFSNDRNSGFHFNRDFPHGFGTHNNP